jgi:hypothetical protein
MRRIFFLPVVVGTLVILGLMPVTQQLGILNTQSYNAEALDATNLNTSIVTKNVQWSYFVTVSGKLSNAATGAGIGGKLLTFDGTGGTKMTKVITNPDGSFVAGGIAPNSVATGWTIKAHFAGNANFGVSNSNEVTYNTIKHNARIALAILPSTIEEGGSYAVIAQLNDALTGKPIGSRQVSFTADLPITISDATTNSSGAAVVSGLTAPSAGSYQIQAHFAADSLYNSIDSQTKVLITNGALTPDAYEPNDNLGQAADIGSTVNDQIVIDDANMHATTDEDWYKAVALETGGINDLDITVTLTGIPAGSNYDLYVTCPDCDFPGTIVSNKSGNQNESVVLFKSDIFGENDDVGLQIEVRNISDTASSAEYTLTITVT